MSFDDDELDDVVEDDEAPAAKKAIRRSAALGETVRPLRGGRRPSPSFCTLDLETYRVTTPYLAGFCWEDRFGNLRFIKFRSEHWRKRRSKTPTVVEQFLRFFLVPRFAGRTCYAHNGGKFDFLWLLPFFIKGEMFAREGFTAKLVPIGSCLFRMEIRHPRQRKPWIFSDSYRLLKISVKQIGEAFGETEDSRKGDLFDTLKVTRGKRRVTARIPAFGVTATAVIKRRVRRGAERRDYIEDAEISATFRAKQKVWDVLPQDRFAQVVESYNRADCVTLHKGIAAFERVIVDELGGEMKSTTPATSVATWRRAFQRAELYKNRHLPDCPDLQREEGEAPTCGQGDDPPCGHVLFREAFAGGRTEIMTMYGKARRRRGKLDPKTFLRYSDYNAHYLACMQEPMPVGRAEVVAGGTEAEVFARAAGGEVGIIECDVFIDPRCYFPPLPWKSGPRQGGEAHKEAKLVFPVGTFSGAWDVTELALLKECTDAAGKKVPARITNVRRQVWMHAESAFAEYADLLWKLRKTGKPALKEVAKLLGNAFFGKWSQREDAIEFYLSPHASVVDGKGLQPMTDRNKDPKIGWDLDWWWGPSSHKPAHVCPHISTHITSIARARLWRKGQQILKKGGTLYYMDTDSLIYSGVSLPDEEQLGGMKLEHVCEAADFELPKMYHLLCADSCPKCGTRKRHHRTKGMSPGFGEPLDHIDWLALMAGDKVQRMRLTQLNEYMNAIYKGAAAGNPQLIAQWKGVVGDYTKREVCPDGVTTQALLANDNELVTRKSPGGKIKASGKGSARSLKPKRREKGEKPWPTSRRSSRPAPSRSLKGKRRTRTKS